jgi:hypothetical protein
MPRARNKTRSKATPLSLRPTVEDEKVIQELDALCSSQRPAIDRSTAIREALYLWVDVKAGRKTVSEGKSK